MNSTIARYRLAAFGLLCGLALSACDAIKDVRSEPATALPKQRVVLEGTVYGLGIRRSIGLQNGNSPNVPITLVQGVLGEAVGPRGRETRFDFGALEDGAPYDIVVTPDLVPFGKICEVNNGVGTLHYDENDLYKGSPRNIEVVCADDPAVERYDIQVAVPEPFRSAPGALVTLMTEEGVYTADPKDLADGDPEYVWFRDALLTLPATGVLPFQNIVKAYTREGSTASLLLINRCAVSNHTFPSPAGVGADVTNVAVGACGFSVGGNDPASGGAVRYSRPIGVNADPAMGAGGVTLELRYANGDPVPSTTGPVTEVNITSFGSSFTFPTMVTSGAECPVQLAGEAPIPCEVRGFYEVVVTQQPAGQHCIAASTTTGMKGPLLPGNPTTARSSTMNANFNHGAAANLFILDESVGTGTFPDVPSDFTGLRVYCRNLPAVDRTLTGTYQVTNLTTYSGGSITNTIPWSPNYTARRLYSHMLTFFDDGTFLFGAHTAADSVNTNSVTNHAEQGFYDYDPANVGGGNATVTGPKLRFTVHVDGNNGGAVAELPAGISSAEGPRTIGTGAVGVRHQVLTDVVFGTMQVGTFTARTLSGRFGPDGSPATTAARDVELVEPLSITSQLTGSWISQDHQRFWSYQYDTTYGFHAGVSGFPNVQDNCFKMDDYTQSSGQYVPSPGGGAVYCNPVGSAFQSNLSSVAHSPPPLLQNRLPGWIGWMPGGELGGGSSARSPSPVKFLIATPATFLAVADAEVFPAASLPSTSWCTTEILGVRSTLNGEIVPDRKPVYFCRYRAN